MAYDNERIFAERLANVFLQDNKVKVADCGNQAIACCNVVTKQMWFDFKNIFPASADDDKIFQSMMVYKGLAFHEIMHLKFTSRKKKAQLSIPFMKFLGQLEDGRIETLGVMLHEKLADYFICAVNEILIKDRKAIVENKDNWLLYAYILCYGRSIYFQDLDLLTMMREMIIKIYGKETAELIETTVNDFMPERSFEKRILIAQKLYDFLNNKQALPKMDNSGMSDSFIDTSKDESAGNTDKDLKDLMKDFPQLKKAMEDIAKKLSEKTKDVKDDGEGKSKAQQQKNDKLADLSQQRQKVYKEIYDEKDDKKRQEMREKINEITDKIKSTQNASGYSPQGMDDIKDKLKDKIKAKKEEQEQLVEEHKQDLTQDLKSIGHEVKEIFADNTFEVTKDMKETAKELEKHLTKLNNELAKGYQAKNTSGRLNVRSLLNRKNVLDFKVFNRYTPDKLRLTKALVNIYLDGSGSMGQDNRWENALSTMWVINEALNRDENKVMIYQFSGGYQLIKGYDKVLSVPVMMGGGTEPSGAIQNSIPIIEAYRKARSFGSVLDIIITDGDFSDFHNVAIERLNALGHETILINVSSYIQSHKAKHVIHLQNFRELTGSLTKIFVAIKKGMVAKAKVN